MNTAPDQHPPSGPDAEQKRLTRTFIFLGLCLTAVIAGLALIEYRHVSSLASQLARTSAVSTYNKDIAYRRWATRHGGVYVPVTETTPVNPYLEHVPEQNIMTPSGRRLTLMNPAYMIRQVYEQAKEQYGDQGHITSLRPLRPGNAPDAWETKALHAFEAGVQEVSSVEMIGGEPYMRLMRPMPVESGCLKCHARQGYKLGDIRGGISVSVPWKQYRNVAMAQLYTVLRGYGFVWVLGIAGLWYAERRFRQSLLQRKAIEEALQSSLREKETLLRELYHRTKNNMQVISSLLSLQSGVLKEKGMIRILADTRNRIRAMSLVHEKLYQSKDLSFVDLNQYVRDLAQSIVQGYGTGSGRITLEIEIEELALSIDTITPLGLIINELLTNSLKYAFPDDRHGTIRITARLEGEGEIAVGCSDNGVGLPEGFDPRNTDSLGMQLVHSLAEIQLRGRLEISSCKDKGTCFNLWFHDRRERQA